MARRQDLQRSGREKPAFQTSEECGGGGWPGGEYQWTIQVSSSAPGHNDVIRFLYKHNNWGAADNLPAAPRLKKEEQQGRENLSGERERDTGWEGRYHSMYSASQCTVYLLGNLEAHDVFIVFCRGEAGVSRDVSRV